MERCFHGHLLPALFSIFNPLKPSIIDASMPKMTGGTVNQHGAFLMRATSVGQDTALAQILGLVQVCVCAWMGV